MAPPQSKKRSLTQAAVNNPTLSNDPITTLLNNHEKQIRKSNEASLKIVSQLIDYVKELESMKQQVKNVLIENQEIKKRSTNMACKPVKYNTSFKFYFIV